MSTNEMNSDENKENEQNTSILLDDFITVNPFLQITSCGGRISCSLCNTTLKIRKRDGLRYLRRHISTDKHISNAENVENRRESFTIEKNIFSDEFVKMIIRSNIPLSKVDFPAFRDFFSKFCGRKLNSSSHYRKNILPRLANQCDKQILSIF